MFRLSIAIALVCTFFVANQSAYSQSKKKYHCEIKKNGKTIDDHKIKSRKECKKKGGKWVKDHGDHDHGVDGEDHEHEED